MTDINVLPVLLGGDLNCYTLARAFYEACGVVSQAFGRYPLGQTQHSRFLNFCAVPNLDTPEILVQVLTDFAAKHPDEPLIVLGCTDDYASLLISCKAELEPYYIVPYIDADLRDRLVSKADFYALCDEYDIPYPRTKVLTADFSPAFLTPEALGFDYPVIVKPSSSIDYWKHPFEGMKKVYVAQTPDEAEAIVRQIYAAGYPERMIIQDLIPGDDSRMHVLTAYSDRDGSVKMTCLGHVMLEEHTPKGLGNHCAILTEQDKALTDRFRALLNDLGYRGFS
ncbi:MAG: ATP-grasp domain-containing protein, partial [Clostridia bacterium]|nr:ATP-grasp domain-containing protein [Clostridia bacterium]